MIIPYWAKLLNANLPDIRCSYKLHIFGFPNFLHEQFFKGGLCFLQLHCSIDTQPSVFVKYPRYTIGLFVIFLRWHPKVSADFPSSVWRVCMEEFGLQWGNEFLKTAQPSSQRAWTLPRICELVYRTCAEPWEPNSSRGRWLADPGDNITQPTDTPNM